MAAIAQLLSHVYHMRLAMLALTMLALIGATFLWFGGARDLRGLVVSWWHYFLVDADDDDHEWWYWQCSYCGHWLTNSWEQGNYVEVENADHEGNIQVAYHCLWCRIANLERERDALRDMLNRG